METPDQRRQQLFKERKEQLLADLRQQYLPATPQERQRLKAQADRIKNAYQCRMCADLAFMADAVFPFCSEQCHALWAKDNSPTTGYTRTIHDIQQRFLAMGQRDRR